MGALTLEESPMEVPGGRWKGAGSSTWARTRDLRINRKTGSSKTYINQ